MNAFITQSNAARAELKRLTGMDELDYQLLILESGCQFLERTVTVVPEVDAETARLYRAHLMACGFWDWYTARFRTVEMDVMKRWNTIEPLVMQQPKAYKRTRLIQEAEGIRIYEHHLASFDTWLKLLGDNRILTIKTKEHAH